MNIYTIDENYIQYLKQFDERVPDTKGETSFGRKYVGTIIEVKSHYYFAPLTSRTTRKNKYTGKIEPRKNFTDVYLWGHKGRPLGALKINNMVPIPKKFISIIAKEFNFNEYIKSNDSNKKQYGYLIYNQFQILSKNNINIENEIFNKAIGFYEMRKPKYQKYSPLCCNFKLLEEKALEYDPKMSYIKNNDNSNELE